MDPIIEDYFSGYRFKDDSIDIDFSDLAFSYDYNEVQELYFDQDVNNVILLAGKTGLRKKDMLARVCQDLELRGVSRNSILCIDFDIPAWYGEDVFSIIGDFYRRRASIETPHVIINEIHVIDGWFDLLTRLHGQFPALKILASSSVPSEVYESVYSSGLDYFKVVVLSEKNDSNIKYRTQSFGVFREFKYNIKNNIVEIKGLTKEGKKMPSH